MAARGGHHAIYFEHSVTDTTPPRDHASTALADAIARRRTFAIISHPDAGKTTLTEKLLLYGGAIHLAGSVKARRADRHAASDWMAIEQERGISVSSSAMQFSFNGYDINLLDTPGHEDFSEDTFRTLIASDSAVMLLDNRRGVEDRTRQLFAVCHKRRTPIFTFVNKCDRAGQDPLTLVTNVEDELGIACYPVTWPIFRDGAFVGVYDRTNSSVSLFSRDETHGAKRAPVTAGSAGDDRLRDLLGAEVHARLVDDIALLDGAGHVFSAEDVTEGRLSPVFFGSALTNFGVEPFLRAFLDLAPPPGPRETTEGIVEATSPNFSGFVFKIQANMDPRHRDRVAFMRICSGKFEAGMPVTLARTERMIRLNAPQQFLARERASIDEAWPGDVIGIMDRGDLRIGDSVYTGPAVTFAGIPRFAPEHFARLQLLNPMRRKQFDAGLAQLTEEGAAQVFYDTHERMAGPSPMVGAVGLLQFDVMLHRLKHEYDVQCRLDRLGARFPRWVRGPAADIDRLVGDRGCTLLYDVNGEQLVLFATEYTARWAAEHEKTLAFTTSPP